jgi:hypothetical protein
VSYRVLPAVLWTLAPHHHSLVYYALRCYGSFLSLLLLPLPSSHPSITDYDYYFMLFSFSFLYRHRRRRHSNLKKVNSKEKKYFFFARQPPTCESPNSQNIPFLFSSVPAQHHHYRLNSSPCLHSFNFSGVSITVRSRVCKLKRKYSPWNYRAFPHNS